MNSRNLHFPNITIEGVEYEQVIDDGLTWFAMDFGDDSLVSRWRPVKLRSLMRADVLFSSKEFPQIPKRAIAMAIIAEISRLHEEGKRIAEVYASTAPDEQGVVDPWIKRAMSYWRRTRGGG